MAKKFHHAAFFLTTPPHSEEVLKLVTEWNRKNGKPITFYETLNETRLPSGPLATCLIDLTKLQLIKVDGARDGRLWTFFAGPENKTEQLICGYFHHNVIMAGGVMDEVPSDYVLWGLRERFSYLGDKTLSPTPTEPVDRLAFLKTRVASCLCQPVPLLV